MNEKKKKNDHFIITHQPFHSSFLETHSSDISWDVVRIKEEFGVHLSASFSFFYSTALNIL